MSRRRTLMAAKRSLLPPEYQLLEWLQSYYIASGGGDPYTINTTQQATYQTELRMVVAAVGDLTAAGRSFIAARPADTGNTNALMITSFSSEPKFGFGFFGAWYQAITRDTNFHEYVVSNTNLSVDGVSYGTPLVSSGNSGKTLRIFGENGQSRLVAREQKLKHIAIKQNGVLAFDAYPCYRKSDDKNGFYDLVSNSFFTCSNANLFTRGAEI